MKRDENELRPFQEERFLFINRIAITLIASIALMLSHACLLYTSRCV